MSSTAGLSRTRSIRKPTGKGPESAQRDASRNASPSRLPALKPVTRSTAPAASSASTTTTASSTSRTRPPTTTTRRPISAIFSGKTLTRPTDDATPTSTTGTRPLGRAPSTRRVTPSNTSASTSASTSTAPSRAISTTARPKSSGGPISSTAAASAKRPLGHSRAKSTVTTLTAVTTLRPVSQISSTSASSSTPSTTTSTITRKPTTRSQTQTQTTTRAQSHHSASQPSSPNRAAPTHRPAFNTHQQHYSPAKSSAPKPLTATYLAPPSPSKLPSNIALSAETSRLQTELLQLSLLHRDAAAVTAEWHRSARHKLGGRFRRCADAEAALQARERGVVEARNANALLRWGAADVQGAVSGPQRGLEEKTQVLDQVLSGVWAFSERDSRYARVVEGFEAWAGRVADILAAQRSGDVDALIQGDEVVFLSELDRGWTRECAGLVRKLETWQRMLGEIGDVQEEAEGDDDRGGSGTQMSGVARVVKGCRSLVRDMLAELDVMRQIERDAAAAEEEWIESASADMRAKSTPGRREDVPLWKLVV